ncbi:hypothetical protein EVAR_94211_1 [Eumeta japonica]|uniref:Uncharacterized protein n=1 Tax=Eumeta variegata TaxID=151549 RepID=A0A4C1UP27_EUMVA|nr:hypothetical protein EVAR_94211_1 [Eumeta japonica]
MNARNAAGRPFALTVPNLSYSVRYGVLDVNRAEPTGTADDTGVIAGAEPTPDPCPSSALSIRNEQCKGRVYGYRLVLTG